MDTPLHLAMKNLKNTKGPMGQNTLKNIIRILLKYNADFKIKNKQGKTPLEMNPNE